MHSAHMWLLRQTQPRPLRQQHGRNTFSAGHGGSLQTPIKMMCQAMTSNCFSTHCNTLSSKLNPDAPPFIPNPNPIHNKNNTASIGSTRGKSRRHGQHHNGQTEKHLNMKKNQINISMLNARSLYNKLPEVSHFLQTNHIHIMAITETWLNKSIPDSVVNLPGYQPVFRRDRHTEQEGGGVCMFIANQLPAKYRTDLEHPNLELMWTEIYPNPLSQQKHRSLLIGCCYRPPNSPMTFYEHLETIIDKVAETDNLTW